MEHLEHEIKQDKNRTLSIFQIEALTKNYLLKKTITKRSTITIPVVVHVVYKTDRENISESQIQSQINVLNQDFRRQNADRDNKWSQAADVGIEFCLASRDPQGNPTNGITRTATQAEYFGIKDKVKFTTKGGKNAWPSDEYLNIWVCDIGGGTLGYAQFPGGNSTTDGVVTDYRYFGTEGTATAPFHLGRTTTHEIGHWLNLRHIWGDGNCSADDFVDDTPSSDSPNYGCRHQHQSCNTLDMVQNYMDYSDDACMNLFTAGQRNRMLALFSEGGPRHSLLSSRGCESTNKPDSCVANKLDLKLRLDRYPEETSWTIKDSTGAVVAESDSYKNIDDLSIVTTSLCLVDGCYTFEINDSYGDGICCSYGRGYYVITSGSDTLGIGGEFDKSIQHSFCLKSDTVDEGPTCQDGIQNGTETGIDCGGDCNPCPTCDDGIQNGNETAVDCGGSCDPCPTCDDGILNGQETDIDCGGPDCPACETEEEEEEEEEDNNGLILASYFEDGWDNWTDGGTDCYRYSGSYSYEGSYSIRLRDNAGSNSTMTSPMLDLSPYFAVDLSFYFVPSSMEPSEDFWVEYTSGDGQWTRVATYVSGEHFQNNNYYQANISMTLGEFSFTPQSQFRITCDASSNSDRVYIDQVEIRGQQALSNTKLSTAEFISAYTENRTRLLPEYEGFLIAPNPAHTTVTLSAEENIKRIEVFSITGTKVKDIAVDRKKILLDIQDLIPGVHIIRLTTAEEIVTEKLLKQ